LRVVVIVQAHLGSTRLPGKALKDIGGRTMLARVARRTRRATLLAEVLVATTEKQADSAIVAECEALGVPVFRGSEEDVLDRYYQAAKASDAEAVVRITSDCPLVDPGVIDQVVGAFLDEQVDYASNSIVRTYPRGLEVEVMNTVTLARAWRQAKEPYQRTHVTPYIYENPALFRLVSVTADRDYSGYRWTVDTPEDLEFVREVYAHLGGDDSFSWHDALRLLESEPELLAINSHVRQKTLREG
jgi:spore coat polysaccharide biosynthesis protein SpsF